MPQDKIDVYQMLDVAAIEFDLSAHRFAEHTQDEWQNIILHLSVKTWLHTPVEFMGKAKVAKLLRDTKPQEVGANDFRLRLWKRLDKLIQLEDKRTGA